MASLKALRSRIHTVQATKKITTAMMLVAGAKLRRSQRDLEEALPFIESFFHMLDDLKFLPPGERERNLLLKGPNKENVVLILVISSDRGLCGSFNISIVRQVIKTINALQEEHKKVFFLPIGKKGRDLLKPKYKDLFIDLDTLADSYYETKDPFVKSEILGNGIVKAYEKGIFDKCLVFYTHFHSVLKQNVIAETVLPIPCIYEEPQRTEALYEYEPQLSSLLESFLPDYITTRFYNALLQSSVSEQGARMMAMDGATRNAKEMIQKLQLVYNRSRQASITKELIEIISGAEALK